MVVKPKRLVKASQRRAKSFMLLYGRYVHLSLERVLGEDRSVQQAQFDLCLVLLVVAKFEATKHRVKVGVHAI